MPKLSTYVEIIDYSTGEPTEIYLPDVDDLSVVDSAVLDGTDDDISTELCEIIMKDGERYFCSCSMAFAIDLYKDIMRFKLAEVIGLRTDKLYVL